MSFVGFLVILGCAAAGYWIVSSVMGSGIDLGEAGRKAEEGQRTLPSVGRESHAARRDEAPLRDWHIELDVPADATRADIQAAMKRRLAQAEAVGDTAAVARIRRAAEAGLAAPRR